MNNIENDDKKQEDCLLPKTGNQKIHHEEKKPLIDKILIVMVMAGIGLIKAVTFVGKAVERGYRIIKEKRSSAKAVRLAGGHQENRQEESRTEIRVNNSEKSTIENHLDRQQDFGPVNQAAKTIQITVPQQVIPQPQSIRQTLEEPLNTVAEQSQMEPLNQVAPEPLNAPMPSASIQSQQTAYSQMPSQPLQPSNYQVPAQQYVIQPQDQVINQKSVPAKKTDYGGNGFVIGGLLGIPLSYFFQPAAFRSKVSIERYLTHIPELFEVQEIGTTFIVTCIISAIIGYMIGKKIVK